jgi:transcriptional regulator with XRE-family HTH domain
MNETLNRIKTLRVSKNLKQSEFAKLLNMTQGGYSKIELGITELSVNTLFKIASVLGVSVQHLLFGDEQNTQDESEKDKKIKELEKENYLLKKELQLFREAENLRQERARFYKNVLEIVNKPEYKEYFEEYFKNLFNDLNLANLAIDENNEILQKFIKELENVAQKKP